MAPQVSPPPGWADVIEDCAAERATALRLVRQLRACEIAALAFCRLLERWARRARRLGAGADAGRGGRPAVSRGPGVPRARGARARARGPGERGGDRRA